MNYKQREPNTIYEIDAIFDELRDKILEALSIPKSYMYNIKDIYHI